MPEPSTGRSRKRQAKSRDRLLPRNMTELLIYVILG
jgi:hypothetical protein